MTPEIQAARAAEGWKPHIPRGQAGFTGLIGPFWVRQAAGQWQYAFEAGPQHVNALGLVHGGMLMSFADHVLGIMAWHAIGRKPCATIGLNSQFVSAARQGDWLVATGDVVRTTRSLAFMRGGVSCGGREVLAADGIWKILSVD